MRWPSLHASGARRVRVAGRDVGLASDHPLLRASDAVRYTGGQAVAVGAVLVGGAFALSEGSTWALPLVCSASAVLLVLAVLLAAYKQRTRDCAIDLILEGRERIPVAAVRCERTRLLSERTRTGLAHHLEGMVGQATDRQRLHARASMSLYDVQLVAMVVDDLLDVARLLRTEQASAREIARVERMLERAVSPLYGHDVNALRDELRCVRELLQDRET